jgi:hypothetical protein
MYLYNKNKKMKKILLIALVAFGMNVRAQITLEHTYDTASSLYSNFNLYTDQLMIINFAVSGEKYVKINREGKAIEIYNLNHSLQKKINCSGFPLSNASNPSSLGDILYLSQNLFTTDSKIEFMYCYQYNDINNYAIYATNIYNEDGVLLFSDTCAAAVRLNIPVQQYPIYNTSVGTKMILSYRYGQAKVFSLPGTLTNYIVEANVQLMQAQSGQFSNLYPNPSNGTVTLQYQLPEDESEGEIILYNQQGVEVKRYKVDNTFKDILINNTQLPVGTYFYQLQTNKGAVGTKKMVIVK